ncbi:hypothetical protein A6770_20065 [Nostoc minutum NIES-26]|uniref:Uncharacterized protein n=1 Tax=Nostoc minutum NIES-26 TaxID=1844469 RepID=A0A367R5W6_9NOSO|nr:hypothetical protein [Dendronalium sp. ChiSLP03b]MDZ8204825.1 hypothetical protein [Dendronalium sp. ChiSLP03b]RCJ31300.1 hypothetical protein A6770_20065 [Nostoc minutum NIES-26]
MTYCPCCSGLLLQHVRGSEISWFCRHCWQDMPVFSGNNSGSLTELVVGELSPNLQTRKNTNTRKYTSNRKTVTGWIGVQDVPA